MKAKLTDKISKESVEFNHPDTESGESAADIRTGNSLRALVPNTYWVKNSSDVIYLNGCIFYDQQGVDASLNLLKSWRSDAVNLVWHGVADWMLQSVRYNVVQRLGDKIIHASADIALVKKPKNAVFLGINKPTKTVVKPALTKKEVAQRKPLKRKKPSA